MGPSNRMIRTAALLGAAVLVFAAGAAAHWGWSAWKARQTFVELADDPTQRDSYQHRLTLFERLHSRPTVVMLGDSITQWGEWNELIGPQVANRGIGGDTSEGLRSRLAASVPDSARTVVIMIGLNDLKLEGWRPRDSVANIAAILDGLAGRRVILQSVLPTAMPDQNVRIRELNAAYRALCEARPGCEYLDVAAAVAPDGLLGPDLTNDGRHLRGLGYDRWAALLKAKL